MILEDHKIKFPVLLSLLLLSISAAAQTMPSMEDQIASTILAAPEELRTGAAVLGYGADDKMTELRKGANELICLADDPKDNRYSVSCYHKDLEP